MLPTVPTSIDRRTALAAVLGGLAGTPLLADKEKEPLLDLHVHLFGIGEGGTGCIIQKVITNGFQFQFLTRLLDLRNRAKTLDEGYELAMVEHVKGAGLDRAAILGQDAVYNHKGEADWAKTSFYVPNKYVFDVAARHPKLLIPCPSINPDRADALAELDRCHGKGARLFKIHPPTQGVNVADPKHQKFFRRCKDLDMVVMVHTGHEHSAPVIDKDLANPKRLERALDEGCTVVACHAGTGWPTDKPDQLPEFLNLLKRYKNLWGDTSVLGTAGRVRDIGRLIHDPLARDRLLHGSDFPFPVSAAAHAATIGKEVAARIDKEKSWIKRDLDLKEALGIGVASAKRSYKIAKVGKS